MELLKAMLAKGETDEVRELREMLEAGPPSSRSRLAARAGGIGVAHAQPPTRPLDGLTTDDVCKLLQFLELEKYAVPFRELGMTGRDLGASSLDELEEAGVKFRPHRQRLLDTIAGYKSKGVPLQALGVALPKPGASRSAGDDQCTFTFLDADKVRACRDLKLPNLQELRRTRPDWLVERTFTMQSACDGSLCKEYCAVSHRWETPLEPDTQGAQLRAIQTFLSANRGIRFVWIDYSSMPQGANRSPDEQAEFDSTLPFVNLLYLGSTVLILLDLSYVSRFWVRAAAAASAAAARARARAREHPAAPRLARARSSSR